MWMTGFDAPSVSTIYLDRMMHNHTLMQTIARANRVFPDKDNGLIVDYIGVFRNLEKALAIYGAANTEAGIDAPIQDAASLVAELGLAVDGVIELAADHGVDLAAVRDASGFEHIALRDAAVEALLADETIRTSFLSSARKARKLFKALLPDPAAAAHQATIAAIRSVAARIAALTRPPAADIDELSDAVEELLDN
jgi:type I restriction enzyme R subunit